MNFNESGLCELLAAQADKLLTFAGMSLNEANTKSVFINPMTQFS